MQALCAHPTSLSLSLCLCVRSSAFSAHSHIGYAQYLSFCLVPCSWYRGEDVVATSKKCGPKAVSRRVDHRSRGLGGAYNGRRAASEANWQRPYRRLHKSTWMPLRIT